MHGWPKPWPTDREPGRIALHRITCISPWRRTAYQLENSPSSIISIERTSASGKPAAYDRFPTNALKLSRFPGASEFSRRQERRSRAWAWHGERKMSLWQDGWPHKRAGWRRGWDSNPRYGCPYTAFRVQRIRPLCHLSAHRGSRGASAPRVERSRAVSRWIAACQGAKRAFLREAVHRITRGGCLKRSSTIYLSL